jgi:hypothetical protein
MTDDFHDLSDRELLVSNVNELKHVRKDILEMKDRQREINGRVRVVERLIHVALGGVGVIAFLMAQGLLNGIGG